ncbi:MAG TPA: LCP family protein [Mycobacteriales bacterium]|nr:LCP family protein [Mycobacteriales bacterium]
MTTTAPRGLPPHLDPRGPWLRPTRPRSRWSRRFAWLAGIASAAVLVVSTSGYVLVRYYDANLTRIFTGIPGFKSPQAAADGSVNFLLVGSDSRGGGNGNFNAAPGSATYVSGARSDTSLLVHIPPGSGKIVVVSFPRDSYVEIPAWHGTPAHMNKINSAFSEGNLPAGNAGLLEATIEQMSGLRIDHYVQIDFTGFQNMVNALGGITVCVKTSRADHDSGDFLSAGVHHIDGRQALAFVRDRHTFANQDISRIDDQKYFLSVVLKKVESAGTLLNPFKLNAFLGALTSAVTVDSALSFDDIRNFAERMRHLDPAHVTFVTLPFALSNGFVPGIGSVVLLDPAKDAALFAALKNSNSTSPGRSRPGATVPTKLIVAPSSIRVEVENGTTINGLAHRASSDLSRVGFNVVSVGTNPSQVGAASVVYYGPTRADSARTLAAAVPGSTLRADPSLGSDVRLVLGSGYSGAHAVSIDTTVPSPATSSPPATGINSATAASLSCAP